MEITEQNEGVTAGKILRKARENQHLTADYVAEKLHLKVVIVQALEADDYEKIGGMVYVKGYLRSYARLLNIDIEPQVAALGKEDGARITPQQPIEKRYASYKNLTSAERRRFWIGAGLALSLILLIIIGAALRHNARVKASVEPANFASHMAAPISATAGQALTVSMVTPPSASKPALAATAPTVTANSAKPVANPVVTSPKVAPAEAKAPITLTMPPVDSVHPHSENAPTTSAVKAEAVKPAITETAKESVKSVGLKEADTAESAPAIKEANVDE